MIHFLIQPEVLPFSVSLGAMVLLGVLELLALLAGVDHALDSLLPDLPEFDAMSAADGAHLPELAGESLLFKTLSWLHFRRVPLLVLLTLFLLVFGGTGLVVQYVAGNVTGGRLLPLWMTIVPAFATAVAGVRIGGGWLAAVMPRDETTAVSEQSLIGRIAVVVLGVASRGKPAQAKLRDQHGQTHYVMVEPDDSGDVGSAEFPAGSEVLLVRKVGAVFYGIVNPNAALSDANDAKSSYNETSFPS